MQTGVSEQPFIDRVAQIAAARAAQPAIGELTYGALWRQTARVAIRLRAAGVGPGERVSIFCENRIGFVLAYLAILRLGAIAVPTNVLYRARDLGTILEDAAPVVVVGSAATRPNSKPSRSTNARRAK